MIDWTLVDLLGRFILINIVPFVFFFQLIMKRREQWLGSKHSEIILVAGELQTVGFLGYYIILSIFFYSIPVLKYINKDEFYIFLIEPEDYTVATIAIISFTLVVCAIFMRHRFLWAYRLAVVIINLLLIYSFFHILEIGPVCIVPIIVFGYLLYRLTKPTFLKELLE
ncbi:MAG: hypothetical protein K8S27_09970 [Candidatus Omnitrophica bacterium]|nr:hypothetical protein [Candidatus Omnitrophota bacterium]